MLSSLLVLVSSNFKIYKKLSLKQVPGHHHENTKFQPEQCPALRGRLRPNYCFSVVARDTISWLAILTCQKLLTWW